MRLEVIGRDEVLPGTQFRAGPAAGRPSTVYAVSPPLPLNGTARTSAAD